MAPSPILLSAQVCPPMARDNATHISQANARAFESSLRCIPVIFLYLHLLGQLIISEA
jgi:hypothetical protein